MNTNGCIYDTVTTTKMCKVWVPLRSLRNFFLNKVLSCNNRVLTVWWIPFCCVIWNKSICMRRGDHWWKIRTLTIIPQDRTCQNACNSSLFVSKERLQLTSPIDTSFLAFTFHGIRLGGSAKTIIQNISCCISHLRSLGGGWRHWTYSSTCGTNNSFWHFWTTGLMWSNFFL